MSTSSSTPRTWPLLRFRLPIARRWRAPLLGLAVTLLALLLGATPAREPILRAAGWLLVATDPAAPADIIVISVDADGAGVLDAADLIKAGLSQRVAIFADPPDSVDQEFVRRGLHYYNAADIAVQQLHELGVAQVEVIPRPVSGTEDESRQLPAWGVRHGFHKILFVATTDHTRRTRREFARATRGTALSVMVHGSPYSPFNPNTWWQTREGVRTEALETQKLLLDLLFHPFG